MNLNKTKTATALCQKLEIQAEWPILHESYRRADYANHSEAMADVADYIVGFYNCTRLHSKLGNLSPNAFERESAKQQSIDVSEKT